MVKELDLKELRKYSDDLHDLQEVVDQFENGISSPITRRKKATDAADVLKLKLLHTKIMEKQLNNELIQNLIVDIGRLRGAIAKKDTDHGFALMKKYLHHGKINNMIKEHKKFDQELEDLRNVYPQVCSMTDKRKEFLEYLGVLKDCQKELLINAGNHFSDYAKKLLKN